MTTKQSVELRIQSGEEKTSSSFVVFLYCLLRDCLPVGKIEYIVDAQVFNDSTDDTRRDHTLTNGYIARYAKNLVMRLGAGHSLVYKLGMIIQAYISMELMITSGMILEKYGHQSNFFESIFHE